MIAILLSWVILLIVFLSFGQMVVLLSNKVAKLENHYSLFDLFFIGLCSVGTIICVTSLFVPSGGYVLLGLIATSLVFLILNRKFSSDTVVRIKQVCRTLSSFQMILIGIVALVLLSFVIMPPQLPDTFYYHIQNIMWNEEYRVVPGLANMIEQLGFNSNFFLLSSVFGLKPLFGQFVYSLNALCYGMLVLYFVVSYDKTRQSRIVSLMGIGICFLYFLIYKIHIASPSTDMLPNILMIYLLMSVLSDSKCITKKSVLFWMIPIFCVTLKLSSIFLCLFVVFLVVYFVKNKSYKALVYFCVVTVVISIPWLIRNVVVSGYLIYPFPAIDIFSFDWKMPMEYVMKSKKYVEAYAISVDAMHYSSDYVLNLSFIEKLKRWFAEQPLYEIIVMLLALISPLLMLFAYIKDKANYRKSPIVWVWAIAVMGVLFGLTMAPAIRFGFGFYIMAFCIPLYFILIKNDIMDRLVSSKTLAGLSLAALLIVGALSARYFVSVNNFEKPIYHTLYKPLGLENVRPKREQTITTIQVNNLSINKPSGLSLDGSLPCSGVYIDNIEIRGVCIQEGFRIKK